MKMKRWVPLMLMVFLHLVLLETVYSPVVDYIHTSAFISRDQESPSKTIKDHPPSSLWFISFWKMMSSLVMTAVLLALVACFT